MAFQTFTPLEYLKIDIATSFGLDKEDWDVRINWFDDNESRLDALADQAEEPAMFFAGLQAYRAAERGEAIAYPISLDATASGPQILACLTECSKSAAHCNVIDTGHREDLYTNMPVAMMDRWDGDEKIEVTRKQAKAAIMPAYYGSTREPINTFGEGDMLELFYRTMEEETPGAWKLNEELLSLWRSDVPSHDWRLPDNFHVHTKVMDRRQEEIEFAGEVYEVTTKVNRPMKKGLSIGANVVHSIDGMVVREMLRRCHYSPTRVLEVLELITDPKGKPFGDPLERRNYRMVSLLAEHWQNSGFLSARILDFIDEDSVHALSQDEREAVGELIKSLPEKPFPALSVHDCWRVHPNYGNDLRRQYNRVLHEIAKSTLLEFIAGQIAGEPMPATKFGSIHDDILESNYALS